MGGDRTGAAPPLERSASTRGGQCPESAGSRQRSEPSTAPSATSMRSAGAGELVLVLPGGLCEAVKPHELRYRLLWGHRYGFVRAALRHGAPLVPVASLGADDIIHLVGDRVRALAVARPAVSTAAQCPGARAYPIT